MAVRILCQCPNVPPLLPDATALCPWYWYSGTGTYRVELADGEPGKPGELCACVGRADADAHHLHLGGIKSWHVVKQLLGVLEAVEVPEVREERHHRLAPTRCVERLRDGRVLPCSMHASGAQRHQLGP